MSFPRYESYKDSDVEWLGDLPNVWKIDKIKFNTYVKGRVGWHGLNSNEFRDEGVHLVTGTDFDNGFVNWDRCYRISDERYSEDPYIQLKENDLLITKDGTIGKLARVKGLPGRASLNSGIFLVRAKNKAYLEDYLYWVLQSSLFVHFMDLRKTGSTIQHLYQEVFYQFAFPIPSQSEQYQICIFLDRETAKIDALIAEQQRLIELLKEKRQAIISHAVTKGLNPDAPMKNSGIEWLGEVPAHWELVAFRRVAQIEEGQVSPTDENFSDWILIAPNHIESGTGRILSLETAADQGAISGKYRVRAGEVIYSKIRPALNKVCLAEFDCLCSADMYPIRIVNSFSAEYLVYLMLSQSFVKLMVDESMRVAMPKVNRDTLYGCRIVVPPLEEQKSIIAHIHSEAGKYDALTTEAQRAIILLQERRTALISSTVTGKIDVRGLVTVPVQTEAAA